MFRPRIFCFFGLSKPGLPLMWDMPISYLGMLYWYQFCTLDILVCLMGRPIIMYPLIIHSRAEPIANWHRFLPAVAGVPVIACIA